MPIDHRATIAAEVRAEIFRQHKTQDDLAALLGLSQPSISARLLGRRSFRAEELKTVADWLQVPLSQLTSPPVREGVA